MVHIVGAGPGATDLITVRGRELINRADVIIYAGSLVNPALLEYRKSGCQVYDSAKMTLEEVIALIEAAEQEKKTTVRLHTGDPSIYGAIREQMDAMEKKKIPFDVCPGVSSFCGAASALRMEYTLPNVTQSVIITRMAAHQATMVIFLSTGMLNELTEELIKGGYRPDTPAAIVYKATWEEEKTVICTVESLNASAKRENIKKTALILVGNAVAQNGYERSRLYDPVFTTEYRKGTGDKE